jgi:hypothetical protein
MKKPARDEAAPVDESKPKSEVRPDLLAKALQKTSQKPPQLTGGLFAIRSRGRNGWSGPRRNAAGETIH